MIEHRNEKWTVAQFAGNFWWVSVDEGYDPTARQVGTRGYHPKPFR